MIDKYKTKSLYLKRCADKHKVYPIRIDFTLNDTEDHIIKVFYYKITPEFMDILKEYEMERERYFEELNNK